LSLGSSIERPDYDIMLPGMRYATQYYYTKGNPDLKPTIRYQLKWQTMLYQFINTYLGYDFGSDMQGFVVKTSSFDPLVYGYEYYNIADFSLFYAGGSIYYKLLEEKLSGKIDGYIRHLNYTNPQNGFELPQGKTGYWRGSLNVSCNYQITSQLGVNWQYYFYPKYDNLIYLRHTNWLMNAGVTYNSSKDKWSLALDVNDIFHSNRTFIERSFAGNDSREYSFRNSQYVQLSFIMKFKGGEKVENKAKSGSLETDRFSTK
jgi:hypothetical protein